MTPGSVLGSLNRFGIRAPRLLVGVAGLVTRRALDNARWAADEISAMVNERRDLEHSLDDPGPGDLARLTRAQCQDLLANGSVGRLAYVARAGVPDIVPVNYVMDGESLLIRSAPGPKLQAAERRELVAFEIDGVDEVAHKGWSVVVIGRATRIPPDEASLEGGPQPNPWASGPRRHVIRIEPRRVEGRRLL